MLLMSFCHIDSLSLPMFECLHSDTWNTEYPQRVDINPLIFNSTLARFNKTTLISMMVEEIMIEQ